MTIYKKKLNQTDPRLGRHVNHDSRSRNFPFPTTGLSIQSAVHQRQIPILDQGQVGSCTGNAGIGALGTSPLIAAIPNAPTSYPLNEQGALALYSAAETIDGDGPYPPNDNGSDGLSIAKALLTVGMISGYQHTFSTDAMLKALQVTPVIIGINWYQDMFSPAQDGRLSVTGSIAGGHEIEVREIDAINQCVWIDNSWGTSWGVAGRAYLTFASLDKLLKQEGDCTVLLPATAAPPTPVPPSPTDPAAILAAAFRRGGWNQLQRTGNAKKVADAGNAWMKAEGL